MKKIGNIGCIFFSQVNFKSNKKMNALRIYVAHIYQLSDLTYVKIKKSLIIKRLFELVHWILI